MAFAGLWETWLGPNGEEMDTAAIVTTTASRTLAAIHPRMPVVIAPEAFDLWLGGNDVDAPAATALIAPAPEDALEAHEISPAVNRVTNDSAELIRPAEAMAPTAAPAASPAKTRSAGKNDGQASPFD